MSRWCLHKLSNNEQPEHNTGKSNSSNKRGRSFCITSSNTSPTFQLKERIFNKMTKFV